MKTLDIFDVKANGEYSQITERLFRVDTPQGIKDMGVAADRKLTHLRGMC